MACQVVLRGVCVRCERLYHTFHTIEVLILEFKRGLQAVV